MASKRSFALAMSGGHDDETHGRCRVPTSSGVPEFLSHISIRANAKGRRR